MKRTDLEDPEREAYEASPYLWRGIDGHGVGRWKMVVIVEAVLPVQQIVAYDLYS